MNSCVLKRQIKSTQKIFIFGEKTPSLSLVKIELFSSLCLEVTLFLQACLELLYKVNVLITFNLFLGTANNIFVLGLF